MERILGDITKNYCDIVDVEIVSYSRSMLGYVEQIIPAWNKQFSEYYIYFIDGDHWGEQPQWKSSSQKSPDTYDIATINKLNSIATYKDSMIMFGDEFIIFNDKDIDEELQNLNLEIQYTVSAYKVKVSNIECNSTRGFITIMLKNYSKLKKLKEEFGRAKIYSGELII